MKYADQNFVYTNYKLGKLLRNRAINSGAFVFIKAIKRQALYLFKELAKMLLEP